VTTNGAGSDVLQDTVGAVCVDDCGNVASAVSSGGIILKQPGRLGQVSTIYPVVRKEGATLFWTIIPVFRGGFLQFIYRWKQE